MYCDGKEENFRLSAQSIDEYRYIEWPGRVWLCRNWFWKGECSGDGYYTVETLNWTP